MKENLMPAETELPRQPEPVEIHFIGDVRDVDKYINKIKRIIEGGSYDHVLQPQPNRLKIYPAAIND